MGSSAAIISTPTVGSSSLNGGDIAERFAKVAGRPSARDPNVYVVMGVKKSFEQLRRPNRTGYAAGKAIVESSAIAGCRESSRVCCTMMGAVDWMRDA